MLTIEVPSDLERVLSERAREQGTTPELLALDSLRERFAGIAETPDLSQYATMADFLAGYIGVFDSREFVSGGARLSEDTGRKFADLMVAKRRAGRL